MRCTDTFFWFMTAILVCGCRPIPPETVLQKEVVGSQYSEVQDMVGYSDFLARIEKVDTGIKKDAVETLLGEPSSRTDSTWTYDLTNRHGFPGMPPPSGTTVFPSIAIVFENDSVKDVSRAWMDVSGPAPGL